MEVRAVVNIGPPNSSRVPQTKNASLSSSTYFDGGPSLSENLCHPFMYMNQTTLPDTRALDVSHLSPLKLSKTPTVINVTPQKSRHPSIKVYESPHATMWLTPESSNTYTNVNLPDSSLLHHRSISCLAAGIPAAVSVTPEPKRHSKPNRKTPSVSGCSPKTGGRGPSQSRTSPPHIRDAGLSEASPGILTLPSHHNRNHRQSSDPGNFKSMVRVGPGFSPTGSPASDSQRALRGATDCPHAQQRGRMVENSEDRSRRELESPRLVGPQVRAVHSPNPRQNFRPPSRSSLEMDGMLHGIASQWETSNPLPTPKTPTMMGLPGINLHNPTYRSEGPSSTSTGTPPPSVALWTTSSTKTRDLSGNAGECNESKIPVSGRAAPTPSGSDEDLELTRLPELGETENPPDRVVAKYSEDLNIIKIHEAIMTRFAHEEAEIPGLQARLHPAHGEIGGLHSGMTVNERREYLQNIESMTSRLRDLQNRTALTNYLDKSLSILKAYKLVSSDASKGIVSIRKLGQKPEVDPERISNRLNIIQQYLEVARDYISLDVVHINQIKARCPGCGIDFSQVVIDEESGLCICDCGVERENLSQHSLYKDSTRVNIGNRNNYEDWENFEKALIRYQGRQQSKPPQKLYDQLDAYYRKIQKSLCAEIRSRPSLSDGKKEGTSRQMMLDALCETNNTAYYDDVNLVMNVYWGWKLPDVSHLENQIMQDYYLTQQVYNSEPHQGRDASLNTQFRLYVHLLAVDHRCSREDFKIQTSRDSLEFHQEMWKKMCDKTGVKFHAVI